ncbi:hypothetical protein [Halorussus marinus]|uniref:hypothetical protein n=1 Tax=Halorussus marinus TaxID=2505976 RepID=UPI00106EBF24|nr:hypothetical protein [Halorussus marinus]
MRRREFLGGIVGTLGLSAVGTASGHPGPYRPYGSVSVANAAEAVPGPDDEYVYVAAMDGFAVVDVARPDDPQVVAERRELLADRETGPLRGLQDAKVEGDRLIVAGPADPIPGDVLRGVLIYDVSEPTDPERVAFFETDYPIHNCFLRDGVAYLTGNDNADNPLVMVDVSGDDPTEIGRWSIPGHESAWTETPSNLRTVHDVWVGDGRAYLAQWDAGTWIVDVSDPAAPSFAGRVGGRSREELAAVSDESVRAQILRKPGNHHFSMPNDDGSLLGINKEAWAVDGRGTPGELELWDVSDLEDPTRLSTIDPPPTPDPSLSGTWTTSHNFDIVGDRLFSSWYQGGVKIHDISDPANPELLAWWRKPDEAAFWTARPVTDRFFVASSAGQLEGSRGALYTFGNHAGEQRNPPSLTTTAGGDTETTTATGTEQAALADDATTDDGASSGVPGFGVPAALAGLVGAGAWRRLRD